MTALHLVHDADLVKQLEGALARRTQARRALVETLLMLEVAERSVPAVARDLEGRCVEQVEALREAELAVRSITRC